MALDLFGKLQQPTTLAFLQAYPVPEQARAATAEQLTAVLKAAGHPSAVAKAARIGERLRQPQLVADPLVTRT
ncbi:IS110 family transposase, partial [Lacticaseibacillus rhamnosus]